MLKNLGDIIIESKYRVVHLSMSLICPDKFGMVVVKTSALLSFTSFKDSPENPDEEASKRWALMAESKPAVMSSETSGSYRHRHIPLPLQSNKWYCQISRKHKNTQLACQIRSKLAESNKPRNSSSDLLHH